MTEDVLFKQLVATIDNRTTVVCLHAAGQIQPVDDPFQTLAGDFDLPPFHIHCRSIAVPFMRGFVNEMRAAANEELQKRPLKQRRLGPGGEVGGRIPPPPEGGPGGGGGGVPTPPDGGPVGGSTPSAAALADIRRVTTALIDAKAYPLPERQGHDSGFTYSSRAQNAAWENRDEFRDMGELEERIADVVEQWTAGKGDIAKVRSDLEAGEYEGVLDAVRNGLDAPDLFRGITAKDDATAAVIAQLTEGDTVDLRTLSSFSEDWQWARMFANGASTNLRLTVKGAKGLPVMRISNSPGEDEWLVTGSLQVTKVTRREKTKDDDGFDVWHVEAEATWRP